MGDSPPVQDTLYCGPDLHRAADESHVRRAFCDRARGVRNAVALLSDVGTGRLNRRNEPRFELVVATGKGVDSDETVTAAYAGHGANREWCLSTVVGEYTEAERLVASRPEDLQRRLMELRNTVDVLFVDGMPREFRTAFGLPFAGMPAWVKQRVRVRSDWAAQIDGLRRVTRQETGRILRKYQYRCALTRNPDHYTHFYEDLYKPYVTQRFGAAAHVVEPQAFRRECGRGTLIRVTRDDVVLGASLLRPVGRTMAVVWSAMNPAKDAGDLRGVNDALDYFSLLYAHLHGSRWLDLGPSRPDLLDGILRYKSKWGAEVHGGVVPQSTIYWTCMSKRIPEFLLRHAFVIRVHGSFRAVFVIDGNCNPDAEAARLAAALTPGIKDYRVVALSPRDDRLEVALRGVDANLTLVHASGPAEVMAAITGPAVPARGPMQAARPAAR